MANYADDFESYGTGSGIPTGYTGRWSFGSSDWSRVTDTDVAVQCAETISARASVSMNAVDSDADRDEVEVLARVKTSTVTASTTAGGVVLRGSGSSGTENAYTCIFFGSELRISKYVSATLTTLATTSSLGLSANTYYWIRFRANGTSLQARIWADGSGEPGSWNLSTTDTSISTAGWAGMFNFHQSTRTWRDLAIATNGDTASMGSAPTPVTSDLDGSFVLRSAVQADLSGSFVLRSSIVGDLAGSFALRAPVSGDLAGSFEIAGAAGTTTVTSDLAGSFVIRAASTADLVGSLALRGAVQADQVGGFVLRSAVQGDLSGAFEVAGPGGVTSVFNDLAGAFIVRGQVLRDLGGSFQILGDAPLLVTPSGRIWLIEAEDRTFPITFDDRVTSVHAD